MYIKTFESRQSSRSYTVLWRCEIYPTDEGDNFVIENERHEEVSFQENELFQILDKLFKDKQNAAIQRREAGDCEVSAEHRD